MQPSLPTWTLHQLKPSLTFPRQTGQSSPHWSPTFSRSSLWHSLLLSLLKNKLLGFPCRSRTQLSKNEMKLGHLQKSTIKHGGGGMQSCSTHSKVIPSICAALPNAQIQKRIRWHTVRHRLCFKNWSKTCKTTGTSFLKTLPIKTYLQLPNIVKEPLHRVSFPRYNKQTAHSLMTQLSKLNQCLQPSRHCRPDTANSSKYPLHQQRPPWKNQETQSREKTRGRLNCSPSSQELWQKLSHMPHPLPQQLLFYQASTRPSGRLLTPSFWRNQLNLTTKTGQLIDQLPYSAP